MSTRGRPNGSRLRPTTPTDPTLETHPVPKYRNFSPRSFGQGAISDLPFRHLDELDALSESAAETPEYTGPFDNTARRLLEQVQFYEKLYTEQQEYLGYDYTWGFWVFVTDYSPETLENIPRAMKNLVRTVERHLRSNKKVYMDEVARRFKLDVIQDEQILSGTSDDRIREEFRSQLRTLHSFSDGFPWPPARNMVCLVLDGETASMLASLEFVEVEGDRDHLEEYRAFEGKNIKVVDSSWSCQPLEWWPDTNSTHARAYRGVDQCPIVFLRDLYFDITLGCSDTMRDLYPLHDRCY
ncbi:hypothetical protein N7481_011305 [Penicillium waksmanii]|uniref:uncharacterized protein n=1 Tax=Penicillium waksmanii TaxID=69791 RepID=UPI0025476D7A|nr:uncharacterized protein N7481_011305 [Penicillium waksmanii]KAJ5974095.1 hypothetical protein N7481_011305 [Penicillium waksmanii]